MNEYKSAATSEWSPPLMPHALGSAMVLRRRPSAVSWHFRMLHVAGVALAFPAVAASRLWPSRQRRDESVFVETNRAVLTALGYAYQA